MASRFKESLGFIKLMTTENIYQTENEEAFLEEYMGTLSSIDIPPEADRVLDEEQWARKYPYLPNPFHGGFFDSLYASFLFIYEMDILLAQNEREKLTLENADALLGLCCLLSVSSTNAMISIDDEFSFSKKYSVAEDIYIMTKNMYDFLSSVNIVATEALSFAEMLTVTKYSEIKYRLWCKYIRNGIAVLKLFHILALLQTSPAYSDGIHQIAKKLIQQLREVLFNKRIIKLVVDADTYGSNYKLHKTTRLKIFFAMNNSDRYCIRLDFPHPGEDCIHLNLNEPARKQSTGFPFKGSVYGEAIWICKEKSVFDRLFYYRDDLFWFRSNFAALIKEIGKNNEEHSRALEMFRHDRSHIVITSSDTDNLNAVTEFSEAFAEAMIEYGLPNIYGSTDTEDDIFYQYVLFQDEIFDIVLGIRALEMRNMINIGGRSYLVNTEAVELSKIENLAKTKFCDYIEKSFTQDEELKECVKEDIELSTFLTKCLDRLDELGI